MATVEIWTFRDQSHGTIDLAGFTVDAVDGDIGKIDKASNDVGSSYVVVNTGPWILGKKVMLPAGVISNVDVDTETVYVNRTKDQIKNAPVYDPDETHDSSTSRGQLGDYYGAGQGSQDDS